MLYGAACRGRIRRQGRLTNARELAANLKIRFELLSIKNL